MSIQSRACILAENRSMSYSRITKLKHIVRFALETAPDGAGAADDMTGLALPEAAPYEPALRGILIVYAVLHEELAAAYRRDDLALRGEAVID